MLIYYVLAFLVSLTGAAAAYAFIEQRRLHKKCTVDD